jgi:integrase
MPRRPAPWYRSQLDSWYARDLNGRQVPLGVRGRDAEAAAWIAFARLRSGVPPVPAPPVPAPWPAAATEQLVSCGGVLSAFLDDAAGRVKPDTLALYRLFLDPFAKQHGATAAAALTCPSVEAYSRRATWNASTRSAFLAVLVRAFRFAERARLLDRSPLRDLRRPAIGSRAADVVLTAEQHAKLCEVSPAPFAAFLRFVWLTGCRPGEAAQLAAADVDWTLGTAVIRQHKTRHKGKRRVLYLAPAAVTMLRGLADARPVGPLLRNRIGKPWTRATLGMAMRKARKAAGLPSAILYGLRHSYITDALAAGVSDALVAQLAGHSSTAMIHRHYNHVGERVKVLSDAAKVVR